MMTAITVNTIKKLDTGAPIHPGLTAFVDVPHLHKILRIIRKDRDSWPAKDFPKYAVIEPNQLNPEAGNYTSNVTGPHASPKSWKPGCLAIPEEGEIYIATGGNRYDGAEAWEPTGLAVEKGGQS